MSENDRAEARDYKDTLNLPRTEFPMKGNLGQLEPRLLKWWEEQRIYGKMLEKNAAAPPFVFHDGPPYANGRLHAGHALNKILKDIVVKYRNLAGQRCDFIPGWDCHGLPIERAVEQRLKESKVDRRALSQDEFLQRCRDYALEFIAIQRDEFKRMGVFGRWDEPYKTLSFDYEAQEIRELATIARRGLLYRRKKPVYWCINDHTALAEAEVEYEDHTSPSVYVAFNAVGDLSTRWPKLAGKRVAFAIWTTTPWTLPANLAIAVHPKVEYVFYDSGARVLVIAKDLLPRVLADLSGTPPATAQGQVLGHALGTELAGLRYQHVFYDRTSPVILGEHVTLDQGTGLVHTAPGHGQEDYEAGLANGLDIYNPVGNDGRFEDTVGPQLAGKKVFEANPIIVQMLNERGSLLNQPGAQIRHSYPHCWRCRNPVILRATHQWFISLDKTGLRRNALAEIDRVQWIPRWGRDRIYGMLENRPDWCISRQRQWGVPIPLLLCQRCGEAVVSPEMMERVAQAVEKEGTGIWYRANPTEFLSPQFRCQQCGQADFQKETDILDVWFDSACSFAAVAEKRLGMPVDLYLEGSDQHRGWFHSTLLVGVGTRDRSPYRSCLTHGFVVDGEGKKMSKSQGNVVAPDRMIQQYGAEVLRLWVASSDYRDDVRLSNEIVKGLAEGYRKIRNTLRYALSNLYDFDPAGDWVSHSQLQPLDSWALNRLQQLTAKVRKAYDNYEFHIVFHAMVDFCAMDLSSLYFDILKDRLYTSKTGGPKRRSAQTVLYQIARDLLRLLAPVMSFTAEEAWQLLPGEKEESIFLAGLPEASGPLVDDKLIVDYDQLFEIRSEIQKLLEAARRDKQIGASLEAKLVISARSAAYDLLSSHRSDLPTLFIVSQVEVASSPSPLAQPLPLSGPLGKSDIRAEVVPAEGQKCPRCWTYAPEVGTRSEVCNKCLEALGPSGTPKP